MTLEELLLQNRSYRRFDQTRDLDEATLVRLVSFTRLCPSAANRQPLKFLVSCAPDRNARIFPHLRWAAALADWPGPDEGQRPAGYIVIVADTRIADKLYDWDVGIAAQSMLLAAAEIGLGGCMIGSIDREALAAELGLPDHLPIQLVLALGHPAEKIVLQDASPDEKPYWRDDQGTHHVPKRPIEELLIHWRE